MAFDVLFIVQHYVLYPVAAQTNPDDERARLIVEHD